ncbi:MAG TPA: hypothetical protein VFV93_16255 [Thermomicrobiales bacterium]|nr:hypothetical protein [Thermomicrobiales bacterium]
MLKWLSSVMMAMLLVLALAGCGGGDDDDDPTATATTQATTPAATATATSSVSGGAAASPTALTATREPEASPTARATAPSRPIATQPPTATATETTGEGIPSLDAQLMELLLQPEDFTSEWSQDAFGLMESDTDDSDEICGQPPFPDRDQKLAGVEAQYSIGGDQPAFLLHNIVVFPDDTAVDALNYARDISGCGEWTDADGQVYTILPLDGPDRGDDSFMASMSFESNGTPLYGEYTFVRVGGAIATVAFITVDGADTSAHRALVDLAVTRLEDASIGAGTGALDRMLLTAEDLALVDEVNVWQVGDEIDPSEADRFAVCDSESFPDVLGSADESGHEMSANDDAGPYAMHSVVQMLAGDGTTAMDWIRSELSCSSWTDEDGDEYTVSDSGDLEVGDDTFWLIVSLTDEESDTSAQVGFGFSQVGDYISVVGLAAEDTIDPELFGAMMALAAEKVSVNAP